MAPRLQTRDRARDLRRVMTQSEVWLWMRIRRQPGVRFRRQHPCGSYILDFYCADARLAVEVDGGVHRDDDQALHDARRDEWLREQGIRILRVAAQDVLAAPDVTAERVLERARAIIARF